VLNLLVYLLFYFTYLLTHNFTLNFGTLSARQVCRQLLTQLCHCQPELSAVNSLKPSCHTMRHSGVPNAHSHYWRRKRTLTISTMYCRVIISCRCYHIWSICFRHLWSNMRSPLSPAAAA